ncbi:hypothetical protein B0H14DRAFT_3468438 [Mycena olivaceomarginata]|nr:hypothetical protein B0H14DRAFT_3468438 [Mycena olivaceomarginata]
MNRGVMHASDDTLAASFLQLSIALRSTVSGEPVALAGNAVRRYAGQRLRGGEIIATLEDYIGNATADLLRMAAWDSVHSAAPPTPTCRPFRYILPPAHRTPDQRLERIRNSTFVGRCLRAQLGVLRACLEGRVTTYGSKVIAVDRELSRLCGT